MLPPHSRYATERLLEQLAVVTAQLLGFEPRWRAVFAPTPELQLLRTLPGVGWVLAGVLGLEIGAIARFPSAAPLAASAGRTPRGPASGGAPTPASSGATATAPSSGPASKRRVPSASSARSGRTGTSLAATRASSSGRATRRRSGPSRAPGPRPAIGSGPSGSRTREPAARPASSTEGPARDPPGARDARQVLATFLRDTLLPR
jgi:hypothetical protein